MKTSNSVSNALGRLYKALPVVRELKALCARFGRLHLRLLESSAVIQAIEALKAGNPRYRDPQRLLTYGAQYWSQNYEDGMIAEIFRRIGTTSRTFLEIGVGDGSENNTTSLLCAGWSGWWIEGDPVCCDSISKRLKEMPGIASRLTLRSTFVSAENIAKLLESLNVPMEIDLFSLDIDLNTYHIWAALTSFRPRVIVVEYNSQIPPEVPWIHPYEPDKIWDATQASGAGLKAYELLARERGYSLVGCDILGTNAFFIRDDLLGDAFAEPFTAENHFEPARFDLCYRFGHARKFFGESY